MDGRIIDKTIVLSEAATEHYLGEAERYVSLLQRGKTDPSLLTFGANAYFLTLFPHAIIKSGQPVSERMLGQIEDLSADYGVEIPGGIWAKITAARPDVVRQLPSPSPAPILGAGRAS